MLLPLGDDLERPNFPVATVFLIFLNVAVFALVTRMGLTIDFMVPETDPGFGRQLRNIETFYGIWGAVPRELMAGKIIGLITYMFLHVGLVHLIGNMLTLWVFGPSLETALGGMSFILLYIFWGAVACAAHTATNLSSDVFLIGASGAIAGVLGAYILLFGYSAKIKMLLWLGVFPFRFRMPAIAFGVFWILTQLYNASIDFDGTASGVAWMAHVGGFGGGVVCMWLFRQQTDRVLVREEDSLRFISRNELEVKSSKANPAPQTATVTNMKTAPIESRVCSGCGSVLKPEHLIGDRLLRCPNGDCSRMTYISEAELQSVAH